MAFYVDSADATDIAAASQSGLIVGVTTNPTLMARAGSAAGDFAALERALEVSEGLVFYQLVSRTLAVRQDEAHAAAALGPGRVALKIPTTFENLALARALVGAGHTVGMTAIFSAAQVALAVAAGAHFVLPYVNRATRLGGDGPAMVRRMRGIIDAADATTRILAASIKTPAEATATLLAGAHDLTLPLGVLRAMGDHALSEQAIADFDAAAFS